jgi:hypothetical protein
MAKVVKTKRFQLKNAAFLLVAAASGAAGLQAVNMARGSGFEMLGDMPPGGMAIIQCPPHMKRNCEFWAPKDLLEEATGEVKHVRPSSLKERPDAWQESA